MLVYLVSAATACFSSDLEKLINIVTLIPTSLAISKSACLKLYIPKTYLSSPVRLLD